jgi:hypothetical protein
MAATGPEAATAVDQAVKLKLGPNVKVEWAQESAVGGERVTCGVAISTTSSPYTVRTQFIVRQGRVSTPRDLPPEKFMQLGKKYCGPDWVSPRYANPVS